MLHRCGRGTCRRNLPDPVPRTDGPVDLHGLSLESARRIQYSRSHGFCCAALSARSTSQARGRKIQVASLRISGLAGIRISVIGRKRGGYDFHHRAPMGRPLVPWTPLGNGNPPHPPTAGCRPDAPPIRAGSKAEGKTSMVQNPRGICVGLAARPIEMVDCSGTNLAVWRPVQDARARADKGPMGNSRKLRCGSVVGRLRAPDVSFGHRSRFRGRRARSIEGATKNTGRKRFCWSRPVRDWRESLRAPTRLSRL